MTDYVCVHSGVPEIEANIVQDMLQKEGIPAMVRPVYNQVNLIYVYREVWPYYQVLVNAGDAEKALPLVQQFLAAEVAVGATGADLPASTMLTDEQPSVTERHETFSHRGPIYKIGMFLYGLMLGVVLILIISQFWPNAVEFCRSLVGY